MSRRQSHPCSRSVVPPTPPSRNCWGERFSFFNYSDLWQIPVPVLLELDFLEVYIVPSQ